MNTWLQYLAANGAIIPSDRPDEIAGFSSANANANALADGAFISPLIDVGLIEVTGEDAATFLHSQLTNDVERLGNEDVRLAGYCSPKGRLLASFLIWKAASSIMLMVSRDLQPAVQKRLQMFVLRSKAKLTDVTEQKAVIGLFGETAVRALSECLPSPPASPYAKSDSNAGTLLRIPNALGSPRHLWVTDISVAQDMWPTLTKAAAPAGTQAWRRTDIHAGVPQIARSTMEQFVPQMVNLDIIDGINFKKGCYPGQEIVARTHYLGKVKRRTQLALIDSIGIKAGDEIYSDTEPTQPCGMIVNAAANGQGGTDCLVEIKTALATEGTVHAGSVDGPILRFMPLPYLVPDAA